MMKRIWPPVRKGGFNLLELLTVIAIISVLAALLLPSLSRAKARSQSTKCKSNLHQIGLGLSMYVGDNHKFPQYGAYIATHYPTVEDSRYPWIPPWFDRLRPQLSAGWMDKLFLCPAYKWPTIDIRDPPRGVGPVLPLNQGSYGYNAHGSDPIFWDKTRLGLGGTIEKAVDESRVITPSEMYALGDSRLYQFGNRIGGVDRLMIDMQWSGSEIISERHPTGFNVASCDAHVETIKRHVLLEKSVKAVRRWNNDSQPHSETWNTW